LTTDLVQIAKGIALSSHELDGKVAVVTGASRGIGRSIAVAMAREGADVVVSARAADALASLEEDIVALGRSCSVVVADLEVEDQARGIAQQALARHGRIDILVNNAGMIYPLTNLVDFDFADWRRVLEVNLVAVAALTQEVLPSMIAQSSGKIINISSMGGKHPSRAQTAYKASKAALLSLTSCLAAEVKQQGIDVTCICPGGVETEGFHMLFGAERKAPISPESIASLAVFLASERGEALTGTSVDAFGLSNPIFR
jgi:NAD(P)-dependent dehydrogenase (short-subunit alcohol dehydrogenase family)